jgi:predicted nucleic acid-binding protein
MNTFPDTSFLCALYRTQVHSPQVDAFMEQRTGPLPVSTFLLLEFRQSTRFQVRLHTDDRTKGFGKLAASQMLSDLDADLVNQVMIIEAVDWVQVHAIAEEISERHTAKNGHRLADILHVATAIYLKKDTFLSFDTKQRKLARAEGLKIGC